MVWSKGKIYVIVFCLVAVLSAVAYLLKKQPPLATITILAPKVITVGETLTLPIEIDTAQIAINAAEVYLAFDPNKIEVLSVSKEPSIFSLWITDLPTFSNESGTISFAGGLPTPGFTGKGTIGSVTIKIRSIGLAELTFDPKSRILQNDGLGTSLPLSLRPVRINAQ